MKNSWCKGLEDDAKEQMKGYFGSSVLLRERLEHILNEKIRVRGSNVIALEEFDKPSWAYKQADRNGYERAMLEIIELISN
jgi:hypothetical protein